MSVVEHCDIAVIGGGSSAFEAAVAARQAGADRVVMFEKAPEPEAGGNARFSHTGFRFVFDGRDEIRQFIPDVDHDLFETMQLEPYTREQFLDDLNRVTQGQINPVLAAYMVDHSNEALHWMRESGIVWAPDKCVLINGRRYFEPGNILQPKGGGRGQLRQWRAIAERLGIEIRFSSKVIRLHGDQSGIDGLRVLMGDRSYDLKAHAVIACSGGFQANPEMRARYLDVGNTDFMKVRGSRYNTGEVLRMMLDIGAQPAGHWQWAHMSPIDLNAPRVETLLREDGVGNTMNRYDYPLGITVNSLGQRFFDEGEASHAYTYAKTGRAVHLQPGSVAYQIYDKKALAHANYGKDGNATRIDANTIGELATKLGLHPDVLMHTVESFNRSIRTDVPYDRSRLDGRRTEGLSPDKTNWANAIDEPPFYAFPVTGGITFTFGGVGVSTNAEVLNTEARAIKGLYASGDAIGLFFYNYPACTGQTRNVVFSLAAARHAVAAGRLEFLNRDCASR
jgi:tricarballylate dehydrogenase